MTDEFDPEEWVAELAESREEKDEFFATHPQSPIPPEERSSFDGLDYYPPDPDYRVTATVTVHDDPEPVEMETTAGPPVRYLRAATFAFGLPDASGGESEDDPADAGYRLHAYRQETDDEETLFVPFRDKTTGQQTYETGRYMELEPAGVLADGDEVVVDFNLAYTPFCAFSEAFSCPLPPGENWLETTVEAGERGR